MFDLILTSRLHAPSPHHLLTHQGTRDVTSQDQNTGLLMMSTASVDTSKRPSSSAGDPIEGHKCFMCGVGCPDANALDTHVIRCAKGQLSNTSRRRDSLPSTTTEGSVNDTASGETLMVNVGAVFQQSGSAHGTSHDTHASEPPSTVPSHDASFEVPQRRLSQHSAPDDHLDSSHDCAAGVFDGPLSHEVVVATVVRTDDQEHPDELRSPNVSLTDQTPTSHPPSANASPRPRRRRAHTSHADVETVEEEEGAAAERRRRRFVMEEQLQSLESMQQANQERLRRQALAAAAQGHSATHQVSLDGSINESFSSPTLSSPHQGSTGRMVIPAPRPMLRHASDATPLSSSSGATAAGNVSPNAFLRNHTTVVWSDKYDAVEGSPSPTKDQAVRSPLAGSRSDKAQRASLERSSSAVVLPYDAPRRSTIAPNMTTMLPPPALSPQGASRAALHHHRDPAMHAAITSPLPQRAPFRVTGRSVTTAQTAASVGKQQGRTSSSDARSRLATSSPQPITRRSSTVAGQKRNTLPPSYNAHHHTDAAAHHDVPHSLNSSVEGPRTEQPPMPRASTAVRQRTQPITAISTSKIQMLLPPSRKVPTTTADPLSSSMRVGGSASYGPSAAAHTTKNGTIGPSGASSGTRRTGAAPTAPSSLSTPTASSGYASRVVKRPLGTATEKIAALSASTSAGGAHHTTKSAAASGTVLTVSSGSVSIGGAVAQPHHSTLRAPNASKRPLTSAALHSATAAASPPHTRGVVPPPPIRQPSNSIARRSTTPPGRLGSPQPAADGASSNAVVTFCTQCGNRYVEGAKFCAFCGHKREDPAASPIAAATKAAISFETIAADVSTASRDAATAASSAPQSELELDTRDHLLEEVSTH
jgi:hypothetical protein